MDGPEVALDLRGANQVLAKAVQGYEKADFQGLINLLFHCHSRLLQHTHQIARRLLLPPPVILEKIVLFFPNLETEDRVAPSLSRQHAAIPMNT